MESINKKTYVELFNRDYRSFAYTEWNSEKNCFVAKVDKFESIIGEGASPDEAIEALEKTFVAVLTIFEPAPQRSIWQMIGDGWVKLSNVVFKMLAPSLPKAPSEESVFKDGMTMEEMEQTWDERQSGYLQPWNFSMQEFEKSWRRKDQEFLHASQRVIPSPAKTKLAVYFNAVEVRMGFEYGRVGVLYGNLQEPCLELIRLVCSSPEWLNEKYIFALGYRDGEESVDKASFVLIDTERFCYAQVDYGIGMFSNQYLKEDTLYGQISGYKIRKRNLKYKLADLSWRKCERLLLPES